MSTKDKLRVIFYWLPIWISQKRYHAKRGWKVGLYSGPFPSYTCGESIWCGLKYILKCKAIK